MINKCFAKSLTNFGELKEEALSNKDRVISKDEYKKVDDALYQVRLMLNEFRCYGLTRIHRLDALKENSIFPRNLFHPSQTREEHFADTQKRCPKID